MISGLFFVAKILDELIITQSNKIVNIIILSSKKRDILCHYLNEQKIWLQKEK